MLRPRTAQLLSAAAKHVQATAVIPPTSTTAHLHSSLATMSIPHSSDPPLALCNLVGTTCLSASRGLPVGIWSASAAIGAGRVRSSEVRRPLDPNYEAARHAERTRALFRRTTQLEISLLSWSLQYDKLVSSGKPARVIQGPPGKIENRKHMKEKAESKEQGAREDEEEEGEGQGRGRLQPLQHNARCR